MKEFMYWNGPGWYASISDAIGTHTRRLSVMRWQDGTMAKVDVHWKTEEVFPRRSDTVFVGPIMAAEIARKSGLGTPKWYGEVPQFPTTVIVEL